MSQEKVTIKSVPDADNLVDVRMVITTGKFATIENALKEWNTATAQDLLAMLKGAWGRKFERYPAHH